MNVTVFGANGNIGNRVVALLLKKGYSVTAFTHGAVHLPQHPRLKIQSGDIYNKNDVASALSGADLVVSTLGSWGTKNKDILTVGMKNIIPAMERVSSKRIISLTGSGVLLPEDHATWYDYLNPLLLRLVAPKILHDGEKHIELLSKSQLDWTVLRSPIMKDGVATGYVLQKHPPLPWKRIVRDDVAQALVDLIDSQDHSRTAPFIQ